MMRTNLKGLRQWILGHQKLDSHVMTPNDMILRMNWILDKNYKYLYWSMNRVKVL